MWMTIWRLKEAGKAEHPEGNRVAAMKLLLGSLLLAGVCWLGDTVHPADIPTMPNFEVQRILRTWYPLGIIPSDVYKPISRVAFPPLRFLLLPNGNLIYRIRVPQDGRCVNKDTEMIKEGAEPGFYANTAPSTMRFVDTDYNTYLIVFITLGPDSFLALSGGQPNFTTDLRQKFMTVARSLGMTPEIQDGSMQALC